MADDAFGPATPGRMNARVPRFQAKGGRSPGVVNGKDNGFFPAHDTKA